MSDLNAPHSRRAWIFALAIAAITFVVFSPVLRNDFVAWDDPQTVVENSALNPPTIENVARFWIEPIAGLYVPLTYTTWAAIASVARDSVGAMHAWPFHLVSLVAHCISAMLVFAILRRLIGANLAAGIGALLFALHPLQVESVSWTSGLKDVLAGGLALAALHQHLRQRRIASSVIFALAMFAKPSAASAIFIAAIIELLIVRRPFRKSISMLWPWCVIALPLLIIARIAQATDALPYVTLLHRPLVAMDAISFYLTKLAVPLRLAIDYGRTPAQIVNQGIVRIALLLPILIAIIVVFTRSRVLITACLVALAGLIWTLGLTPFQFQFYSTVSDHYMYLAMLGPALALAHGFNRIKPRLGLPLTTIILATFAVLSFRQALIWRDSENLFTHAIAVNPRSTASHDNYGRVLGERGDLTGAAKQFEASLAIQSNNAVARRNLALVEFRRGNIDAAIDHLKRAVRDMDDAGEDVSADRRELVKWLASRNRWSQVVTQLERARELDPTNADIAQLLVAARQRVALPPTSAPTNR